MGSLATSRMLLGFSPVPVVSPTWPTAPFHCSWGGRGRAGVVGACLLAHLYGLSADEALERVQRSFDTRKDGGRRSPETDEQHAFVREWIVQRQA